MIIEDLYSRRYKKEHGLFPDVFIYELMPEKLKITLSKIFIKSLEQCDQVDRQHDTDYYEEIHDIICEEHGLKIIGDQFDDFESRITDFFIEEKDIFIDLDIANIVLNTLFRVSKINSYLSSQFLSFIQEINQRMLEHGFGYQYEDGLLIRFDSKHTHAEIIKPTLLLLQNEKFQNADDEFRKAFDAYKEGSYEEAIREANNAFESTMKIICHHKNYGLPNKKTATALIAHLREKALIPDFQMEVFNGLAKCLESVSPIRNNIAGHGKGHEERTIEPSMVSYVLNMTASNIKFLVELADFE